MTAVTSGYTMGHNKVLLANQLTEQLIIASLGRLCFSILEVLCHMPHRDLCSVVFDGVRVKIPLNILGVEQKRFEMRLTLTCFSIKISYIDFKSYETSGSKV